jgi:hypothetical protein
MNSSDHQIVAARKIDPEALVARDTWPSPPPSSAKQADESDVHDTIPTPPPESGPVEVVVIPGHPRVNVD